MRVIKVKIDQSILDVSLQEYGSIAGARWIVQDNELINTETDNIFEGDELNIREQKINSRLQKNLSEFPIQTVKGARGDGVGFMAIGVDFEIS